MISNNEKDKIGIIIEVRSNSSRLPNKHLLKVLNKPLIDHMLYRLKRVKNIDHIILATTKNKNNAPFTKVMSEKEAHPLLKYKQDSLEYHLVLLNEGTNHL